MKNNRINLSILKYKTLQALKNKSIPFELCHFIQMLDHNSDVEWITYLMYQSEQMLRVKGYYKKYPEVEKQFNNQILDDSKRFNW